ncbi:MAG: protein-export chaperone SecB [Sulfuricella sp.]|nr:protein-export chaperone SecB [Sulfuricella sp.]
MSEEQQQPLFNIEKIYLKDASVEVPNAPQVFLARETPQVDVQVHTQGGPVDEGVYEVVLTVTVTAKLPDDKTMFLVEASQAGIFTMRNIPASDLEAILGIGCPNIVFPYVRETISDLVSRSGFPPVILSPMNFEAMYAQKQAQAQADENPGSTH